MELTYRGRCYDYDPPTLEMMEGEAGGLYRGCQWPVRYPRHIPVSQPSHRLQYRGVSYCSHATAENPVADLELTTTPAAAPAKKTDVLLNYKPQTLMALDLETLHQNNICRSLQRRMKVAKAQGDRALMSLLEKESQDLTCALY